MSVIDRIKRIEQSEYEGITDDNRLSSGVHYNATSDLRLPGISGLAKWFGSEFSAAKTIIAVGLNGEIILGYNTCSSQGNMKVRITLFSATEDEELKVRLYLPNNDL